MTDSLEISVSHIDVDELFNHSSCKNVEYRNKSINMCDKQVCIQPSTAAGNVTLPAAVRRAAVDRYHPPAGSTEAAGLLLLLLWAHVGTDVYRRTPDTCTDPASHAARAVPTRSSAIAEGPRDASCQLKSCQLPRNSAETTYTTSPDQIDGMKLEI